MDNTDANINDPPDSELVRELNLTKPQWAITARYWEQRVRLAKNQRNTLIWVVTVVLVGWMIQSFDLRLEPPQHNSFESFIGLFYDWMIQVALMLGIVFLLIAEGLVALLNRTMTRTGLAPEKVKRIIVLGNDVALHTLMLKKTSV